MLVKVLDGIFQKTYKSPGNFRKIKKRTQLKEYSKYFGQLVHSQENTTHIYSFGINLYS